MGPPKTLQLSFSTARLFCFSLSFSSKNDDSAEALKDALIQRKYEFNRKEAKADILDGRKDSLLGTTSICQHLARLFRQVNILMCHISTTVRHVLNLIWFGYVARLSQWGGGG
jgi:hypothetical protein